MRVLVVGGDAAGMSAASRLKRSNQDIEVVVFEKTREVSYGACGIPYYIADLNPHLDLMRIRPVEEFEKSGIIVNLEHEVVKVNPAKQYITVLDIPNGTYRDEPYDKLIVASGSSAKVPPIPGANLPGVFTVKTLSDAHAIKTHLQLPEVKNVAIVGGGYIGLELAEACVLQHKTVRIFEAMPNLLNGFDEEFGEAVEQELTRHGVEVHTGQGVVELLGDDRVQGLICSDQTYNVDMVILAVGVRPNTSFIEDTEIKKENNGALTTNGMMQTSIPNVFAAGDCATVMHKILKRPVYLPLGTNANKQGRLAADAILGKPVSFENALGTAMLRCLDLELAKTGITELDARMAGIEVKAVTVKALSHAPYYPEPVPLTIKLCYDPVTRVLLGAQLMGKKECALRVNIFAVAIDRGMRAEELGLLDLGYAPPFATVWDAVQIAANAVK
ncbi:MAG: CoA-disulfide reductase [Syntrophomonadales bacterium]|jgi:NADPH-dependent 2,4-dienoyl-CoA reductase/sulfur reductase-like enzyme